MPYSQEAFEQEMEQEMEKEMEKNMEQVGGIRYGVRGRRPRSSKPRAKSPSKPHAKSPSKPRAKSHHTPDTISSYKHNENIAKETITSLKKIKKQMKNGGIDLSPFLASLFLLGSKLAFYKNKKNQGKKSTNGKKGRFFGGEKQDQQQDQQQVDAQIYDKFDNVKNKQSNSSDQNYDLDQNGGRKARGIQKKPTVPKSSNIHKQAKRPSSPKPKKVTVSKRFSLHAKRPTSPKPKRTVKNMH